MAEWITAGEPELDVQSYRASRFSPHVGDPRYAAELARETYRYYYLQRYPFDSDEWGRPRRESPLHSRLQDLGCVFGVKNGWERADFFEPGKPWRRAGPDQRPFGWAKPPWFSRLAEEHAAVRERAGIFDMTSFGKIEVSGPGASGLLRRVAANDVDRPPGSVVYTQWLDTRGGVVADVTVSRLGDDRFRVVTGAGTVASDLEWLRSHVVPDEEVRIREETDDWAVIGLWGPRARDVLGAVASDDVSNDGFPFLCARWIDAGGARVWAQRITYVGELGWELYVEPRWAVQVWDRLTEAGAEAGITPAGYRVLDSLRLEKGYRYFGTDLTPDENPFEAGLGFCVAFDDGRDFIGREAVAAARSGGVRQRLRTLLVGDEEYLTIYGGEAVHASGEVVARLRSAGYGFTVRRNLAYAYLPSDIEVGDAVEVEVFGDRVPAEVGATVQYDPANGHTNT
jgi:4-methylaminobutanoate oxidase (formaldehyde-forming)